jgi:hypothetical protein
MNRISNTYFFDVLLDVIGSSDCLPSLCKYITYFFSFVSISVLLRRSKLPVFLTLCLDENFFRKMLYISTLYIRA